MTMTMTTIMTKIVPAVDIDIYVNLVNLCLFLFLRFLLQQFDRLYQRRYSTTGTRQTMPYVTHCNANVL